MISEWCQLALLCPKAGDTAIIRLELGGGGGGVLEDDQQECKEPSGLHLVRALFSLGGGQ